MTVWQTKLYCFIGSAKYSVVLIIDSFIHSFIHPLAELKHARRCYEFKICSHIWSRLCPWKNDVILRGGILHLSYIESLLSKTIEFR